MEDRPVVGEGVEEAGWYLAVGVPLGRWLDPANAEGRAGALIRRGDQFTVIDLDTLDVFLAALTPIRWTELVGVAAESGVADPAALVASLQRDGLVVRFNLEEPDSVAALQRLRLQTLGVGLGNDKDGEPDTFVIGDHHLTPLLTCDGLTYTIWAASDGRSLGAVCGELARGYSMPPEAVLRHALQVLPELLAARVAFLDAAPTGRSDD